MAAKDWQVTQTLKLNGSKVTSSFKIYGDSTDVAALTALLEGGFTVKEVNVSLSDMTNADINVTATNPASMIVMSGENGQSSYIKPYSGAIHFKETATAQDVANALSAIMPFPLAPTAKPTRVSVKRYEGVNLV